VGGDSLLGFTTPSGITDNDNYEIVVLFFYTEPDFEANVAFAEGIDVPTNRLS